MVVLMPFQRTETPVFRPFQAALSRATFMPTMAFISIWAGDVNRFLERWLFDRPNASDHESPVEIAFETRAADDQPGRRTSRRRAT